MDRGPFDCYYTVNAPNPESNRLPLEKLANREEGPRIPEAEFQAVNHGRLGAGR